MPNPWPLKPLARSDRVVALSNTNASARNAPFFISLSKNTTPRSGPNWRYRAWDCPRALSQLMGARRQSSGQKMFHLSIGESFSDTKRNLPPSVLVFARWVAFSESGMFCGADAVRLGNSLGATEIQRRK